VSHEKEFDIMDLIRRSVQAEGLDADAAQRIEQAIQAEGGGLWTRIPKKKKHLLTQQEKTRIVSDGMTDMSTDAVIEKHGISRATLYRLIKRGGQ